MVLEKFIPGSGDPNQRPGWLGPGPGEVTQAQFRAPLPQLPNEGPHADPRAARRNPAEQPDRINVQAAQLDLLHAVVPDKGDQGLDLRRPVADAGKGQQVDGHLASGGSQDIRAGGDLIQAVSDGPVVGAKALVIQAEDADPGGVEAGAD